MGKTVHVFLPHFRAVRYNFTTVNEETKLCFDHNSQSGQHVVAYIPGESKSVY